VRDDDDDDDDRPRRRKRRKEKSGPPVALIFGILAGVFILVGFGVGMFFALRPKSKPDQPEAARNEPLVPDIKNGELPAVLAQKDGWIDFTHPEELYSARVPAKPVHFVPPEGGSVYAPTKSGFANKSQFQSVTKYLNASLVVGIHTQGGLDDWKRSDDLLGPKKLGPDATRRKVMWGGHEAVEDRFEFKRTLIVRRNVFIGNRQYEFTIMGADGRPTAEDLARFFDSFQPKNPK
jgi:hypothetical protein